MLFLHLLQPTITTQSIHRCQTIHSQATHQPRSGQCVDFFSSTSLLLVGPHSLLLCSYTPLSPGTTSDIAQHPISYTKMASSGDVKYPAVNGPGKVSQVYFLLCIDCLSESARLLTLGMTYSDAFRPSLLPFVLISGVRILGDSCIPSEEQRNHVIYSNIALKRRF